MSNPDLASKVEDLSAQIDYVRAVLCEAEHYFESKDDVMWLPYYAGHILLLLQAVDSLLYDMLPRVSDIADTLYEKHGKER